MLINYTHSRAAILCFGGWGLQVMFHLLPRLQAAQEQREALGAAGADLNRITSFAGILAEPLLDDEGQAQFYVRQPRLDQPLPPFFIERLLARMERESLRPFDEQTTGMLTAAERRAMLLLAGAESMLRPLEYNGQGFFWPHAQGAKTGPANAQAQVLRATRGDLFRAALHHAEHLARVLEVHLLDPIRQDTLVEDDPFVQTTLYVVAPLFEPLSAALVWPVAAQLMARVGRQHIAEVIGLFATGSYAADLSRPVEEAASFAALAEIEALTGVRHYADTQEAMRSLVAQGAPALAEQVGHPLFDHIYLLDREKSNQGLAQHSHELAVVAANAIEALSAAGGNLFIQEQLGLGATAGDARPYSVIGAACDYVPLAPIFHAVNRQEESRLVREWVLRNSDEPAAMSAQTGEDNRAATSSATERSEVDLARLQQAAIAQAAIRLPGVLTESSPTAIEALDINLHFILPQPMAATLRRTPAPRWGEAFQSHLDELVEYVALAVGRTAMEEALGTEAIGPDKEWFLPEVDDRVLPVTVAHMQEQLLDELATSPTGLGRAQNQVRRWLREIEQARQRLYTAATPNARMLARVQRELALRNWEASYSQAVANAPSGSSIFLRTILAVVTVTLLSFAYMLAVQQSWDYVQDGLSLLGFAVGISVVGALAYRWGHGRVRQLRRERVAQARTELQTLVQENVTDGLVAAYDRLREVLTNWAQMLAEAASELNTLSTPPVLPAIPPPGVPLIKLYQPHLNQALWDNCLNFLRRQQDAQGHKSEERLDRIWGTATWRNEMRRILQGDAPQNGQTQARTIAQFIRDTVRQSVAPVSIEQPNQVRSELIRQLAERFSVEHLLWRSEQEEEEIQRRLRALEGGLAQPPTKERSELLTNRRYVENAWNRAKPTGNFDVADRLAVYGTTIDFATASGKANSDLTRALLEEFNVTLLPTENPFQISFVRSVHGLSLHDLDAMRRYRDELAYLSADERSLVLLADELFGVLYRWEVKTVVPPPSLAGYSRPPRPQPADVSERVRFG
ncbi:MAG: hypothetical protein DCC55_08645 [Chloroflexi bacterium]|nr:MAG: hypothetical protein DCC55_08645 [Chloroflexota bacterium]